MSNNTYMTAAATRLQPSPRAPKPEIELRPILRWAGGKRQLLDRLHAVFPQDFNLRDNTFYEPFIGGGALTFSLARGIFGAYEQESLRRNQIVIGDQNPLLINLYRTIRDNVDDLIKILNSSQYTPSRDAYYEIRDSRAANTTVEAANFVFLNRLCFNGLYRVNSSGKFNVPYGRINNPTVCDEPLLRLMSQFLRHVDIEHRSFVETTCTATEGDLVYFDPPYIPLSLTSSFTRYAIDDFTEVDHYALMDCIHQLVGRGVRVILSNSFTERTLKIYGVGVLDLYAISANRSISASGESRQRTTEVIGVSYPIQTLSGFQRIST